jgi:hypothetical protein
MFNHEIFAVNFARTLELLREKPPNREQQKASLGAVYALTSLAAATVRCYDGALSVDDVQVPDNLPYFQTLVRHMQAHGIAEIAIARGAPPSDLLTMLRALAIAPGEFAPGDGIKKRLHEAQARSIAVLWAEPDEYRHGRRSPSVTQAFEMQEMPEVAAEKAALADWESLHGTRPTEDAPDPYMPDQGVIDIPVDLTVPPAAPASATEVPPGTPAEPAPAEPASAPARHVWEAPHGVPAATPLGAALALVTHDPYGLGILDRLTELSQEIARALSDDRMELAVQAIAAIIGLEPGAPEGSPRNSYGIVLRRMLTREALTLVAQLVPDPRLAPIATAVLQRGRADGVEVLLGLLATAETLKERKAYMQALHGIEHGTDQVIHMLGHQQWYVARNVAELVGELQLEAAAPELGKLVTHADARVRRAAVVALAKIGTVASVEPLRRALKEANPELKALIAGSIGGPPARALAMPLAALVDAEENEDVKKEYLHALGRIGSAEAVQALIKAAAPGGRLLGRRPAGPRLGAVEGLRLAGGPAAVAALQNLVDDGDKPVREAAKKALQFLESPARSADD